MVTTINNKDLNGYVMFNILHFVKSQNIAFYYIFHDGIYWKYIDKRQIGGSLTNCLTESWI